MHWYRFALRQNNLLRRPWPVVVAVVALLAASSGNEVTAASPPTRVGTTVYKNAGETSHEAFLRIQKTYGGRMGVIRIFYPGLPASWTKIRNDYGDTPIVVSFAPSPSSVLSGRYDAALRAWFASAPKNHDIWWSYWHEPENDSPRQFSYSAYRQAWQRISGIADRAGVGSNMHATLILMCWTLAKNSHRNWRDYYAGDGAIDVLGFDCYNGGHRNGKYRPVQDILGPPAALSRQLGKPWGVGEVGSVRVAGDNGSGRAAWLRSYAHYARANGARFVAYFDSKRKSDYRLTDSYSRSAWRDEVSAEFK